MFNSKNGKQKKIIIGIILIIIIIGILVFLTFYLMKDGFVPEYDPDAIDTSMEKGVGLAMPAPKASWSYFALNEEQEVVFTVKSKEAPNLFCGDNPICIMHDDGQDGDRKPGDGIFSATVSVSSDVEKRDKYYVGYAGPESASTILYFYDDPTEDEIEEFSDWVKEIEELDNKLADSDGYISEDMRAEALQLADDFAQGLLEKDLLSEYRKNQDNVFLKFISGLSYMYVPNVKEDVGEMGDGKEAAVSGDAEKVGDGKEAAVSGDAEKMGDGKEADVSGDAEKEGAELEILSFEPFKKECPWVQLDQTAGGIGTNFASIKFSGKLDNDQVTIDAIKKEFKSDRVILWAGRGSYDLMLHSVVVTGESSDNISLYPADLVSNRLTIIDDRIGFCPGFIDKYCEGMKHSMIYMNCSGSGKDSVLADAFLGKGADVYLGNSDLICGVYACDIQICVMEKMQERNRSTEMYYSVGEALEAAKEEIGANDTVEGGIGATTVLFGDEEYCFGN